MTSRQVDAGDLRDRLKHRSSYSTVNEDVATATATDGSALPAIDALPSRNAISKAPRAAGYRGSDFVHCERLRMPAMTTAPRTPTAGVRKRPMDEIARGGATTVRRALRELDGDVDADDDGWNLARRGWRDLQASDAVAGLKPACRAHNPSVLARILSKQGKVILGSLVTPMA